LRCSLRPAAVEHFVRHYLPSGSNEEAVFSPAWCWDREETITYYIYDRQVDKRRTHSSTYELDLYKEGTRDWTASPLEVAAVDNAFAIWGIVADDLTFEKATSPDKAMVRIGFDLKDGSWSYVGKQCVLPEYSNTEDRTMNFGWSLTTEYGRGTALHEIGHMLGLNHEHQNPKCPFIWDEEKVLAHFNANDGWDEKTTRWNVLNKFTIRKPFPKKKPKKDDGTVFSSHWDPLSIMQYDYPEGLITQPEQYRKGIKHTQHDILSDIDIAWVRFVYGK